MRQKGWFFCITLFGIFLSASFAAGDRSVERLHELSQERYWHILLHMKNGRSEIDDPSFFLTPLENFSPERELRATVAQIGEGNRTLACRYPARILWLKQKLPALFREDDFRCEALEKRLEKANIGGVTLVFPTAYLNSPASMFGHTFLRLDKNMKTPLMGEAVNYAARTEETNGLRYIYNGLLGGYKGYYSVLPYYKKIKEYSAMEQRDMWEYRLNLSHEEMRRMLYHLEELHGIYGNYYFFTKNCSYNLLWLLESAKGETFLPEQFSFKVIPVDTIRLLDKREMISHIYFRPSQRREMQQLVKRIENIDIAKRFIRTYELKLLDDLNDSQKAATLELAVRTLKQRRSREKVEKKVYIKTLMKLLKYRSKLPTGAKLSIPTPTDPLKGHQSVRIAFRVTDHKRFSFEIRPAMHDIYDFEAGYIPGAYIDFFKLRFERSKFQSFDFVSVTSLAARERFFKPLSWRVETGVKRLHERYLSFTVEGGIGGSWKVADALFFGLFTPALYMGEADELSAGVEAGMRYNLKKGKWGVIYKDRFFDNGIRECRTEFFATRVLTKVFALNLKLYEDKIDQKKQTHFEAGFFYYF